jgi:hypothetical protein
MAKCTCGVPSKANWYVELIIGRIVPGGTETTSTENFYCEDHIPGDDQTELYSDLGDGWTVLEEPIVKYLR